MYKKALYSLCTGAFCQATASEDGMTLITRENGRAIRRTVNGRGKVYGARAVSYADAYFVLPNGVMEILGEEVIYDKA